MFLHTENAEVVSLRKYMKVHSRELVMTGVAQSREGRSANATCLHQRYVLDLGMPSDTPALAL